MQLPRDWTDGSTCVPRLRTGVNCLRNTGPHTPEGKAASKQNAITHGLTARQTVLPGESQADFDALLESLHAGYEPATGIEVQLTGEIAACTWRLARARSREAQILESRNDLFSATGESPAFDRVLRFYSFNSLALDTTRHAIDARHVFACIREKFDAGELRSDEFDFLLGRYSEVCHTVYGASEQALQLGRLGRCEVERLPESVFYRDLMAVFVVEVGRP